MRGIFQSAAFATFKKTAVIVLTIASVGSVVMGLYKVMHSPLFTIRVVEVSDLPENAPVDADTITQLANVPIDASNLFDLDLGRIEKRLMNHPWIRSVTISKRFPQTVSIAIVFREPKALLQRGNGELSYIDSNGTLFGKVNLMSQPDLPIVSGISNEENVSARQIQTALKLVDSWIASKLDRVSQISSMSFDPERGLRLLATYSLGRTGHQGRVMIDLGHDFGSSSSEESDSSLGRLRHVLTYLSDNAIAAKQVWADLGKKVVVKITRNS